MIGLEGGFRRDRDPEHAVVGVFPLIVAVSILAIDCVGARGCECYDEATTRLSKSKWEKRRANCVDRVWTLLQIIWTSNKRCVWRLDICQCRLHSYSVIQLLGIPIDSLIL